MTGLNDTDIRLNDEWALTQAADGDAPLCSGLDCLYQNIILEALTQPGDLFYDPAFGWGLYEFIQSEDDDLTRLEIAQRARLGLQKREVIAPESIEIDVGLGSPGRQRHRGRRRTSDALSPLLVRACGPGDRGYLCQCSGGRPGRPIRTGRL